jgi:hypothetical protein
VRWGILTNGRTWRLYLTGTETSEILYYEADLAGILESGDPDAFRRFYLFFRADAFIPDQDGRCFLDRLREESQRYATEVEDSGLAELCRSEDVERAYWMTQREQDFGRAEVQDSHAQVLRIPAHIFCYLLGRAERLRRVLRHRGRADTEGRPHESRP